MDETKIHLPGFPKISIKNKPKNVENQRKSNQCEYCDKYFQKPSALQNHIRIHTGERPYQCSICKSAFSQKSALGTHMLKHTKEKPFACEYCQASFSQKWNLINHVKRLHSAPDNEVRTHKCQLCPCVFMKIGNLNAHFAKVHAGAPPTGKITVEPCETHPSARSRKADSSVKEIKDSKKLCAAKNYLQEDMQLDQKGYPRKLEKLVCTYCSAEFIKPSQLLKHIKIHSEDEPYMCTVCSKCFACESTLELHKQIHLANQENYCSDCGQSFPTEFSLRRHQTIHCSGTEIIDEQDLEIQELIAAAEQSNVNIKSETNSSIISTENGKTCGISSDFQKQKKVPKKVKVYMCVDCHLEFKLKTQLYAHLQMHKPSYNCQFCHRAFYSENSLKDHMKNHDAENYLCNECNKEFSSVDELKDHEKIHLKGFNWSCPVCGLIFTSFLLCKKHVLLGHPQMSKLAPIRQKKTEEQSGPEAADSTIPFDELSLSAVISPSDMEGTTDFTNLVLEMTDESYSLAAINSEESINISEVDSLSAVNVKSQQEMSPNSPQKIFDTNIYGAQTEATNLPSLNMSDTSIILTQDPQFNRYDECNMLCESSDELCLHKSLVDLQEKPHVCSHCDKRFATTDELMEHDESHYYTQELYQCSLCAEVFQTEDECAVHAEICPLPSQSITEEEAVNNTIAAMEPECLSTIF